ncbi:MAG: VOC family protein [bacterium]
MTVKPVPEGYHTVTPYLIVRGVPQLLDFLKRAFDAVETERQTRDGVVTHAEVRIGDSVVMMGEAGDRNPPKPAMLYLYVKDADALYNRALQAGATSARELADEFYGDRVGAVKDSGGNEWWIATHQEDVSPEELARRAEARRQQ